MLVTTALILVVAERLRASGWAGWLRGLLIMLPAVFWAASLAAAIEAFLPRGVRAGPEWLALLGGVALVIAVWLATSGGPMLPWGG